MVKTLIVEDNADFCKSLSELLRLRFPSMLVGQAGNIEEAQRKIAEIRPGLVFLDIKLQEENGLDLARTIRKMKPDITVVVITSFDLPEYRHAAYENGAHYFIPKGSTASKDIIQLVESILMGQPPQWILGSDYINPGLDRPHNKK